MKRSIFLVGALMLVIGFVLHQFGFSSELHQTTLLGTWLAYVARLFAPLGLSIEATAVILQFAGGLLAIFGLLVCFAAVARSSGARFQGVPVAASNKPVRTVANCRFCGAQIEPGSSFCPACKKSQT